MNIHKFALAMAVLLGGISIASANPIQLSVFASFGIFTDFEGGNPLPAGSSFQLIWSTDATYESSGVSAADATLSSGQMSTGDYVIYSGTTDIPGGWAVDEITPDIPNSSVGGNSAHTGFVYGYAYFDVDSNGVDASDQYVRSPIFGNSWTDTTPEDNIPDQINFSSGAGAVTGTSGLVVTPEPGTMALFGLGMLTMAARRRRK